MNKVRTKAKGRKQLKKTYRLLDFFGDEHAELWAIREDGIPTEQEARERAVALVARIGKGARVRVVEVKSTTVCEVTS